MTERLNEFPGIKPSEGLLVVVSKEMQAVKFETRGDSIILSLATAEKLANFILDNGRVP